MRGNRLICLALVCSAAVLAGVVPARAEPLNLEALIEEALANNPELASLKHRVAAFDARVPQAGALGDPTLKLQAVNLPLDGFGYDSTPMSGNQFTLSQMFPFPGTLNAKERAAQHAAEAAKASYEDREGFIVNAVKQAFFSLSFLDRAIGITAKNEALLKDLVRIARTKYAVGRGLQQDVLKAQVALSSIKDKLIVLKRRRRTAEARLNLVLNRPPQNPVGETPEIVLSPLGPSLEDLQQAALSSRPMLRGIEETIERWSATEDLARRQLWPNFTFSLGYRQRAFMAGDPVKGSDFLSFGLGMSLPIYRGRKQRQKVAESQANIRMVEARFESAKQEVLYHVQTTYLEIGQHSEQAQLYRNAILPQAEQSLESAISGYQVDKVDFLTMLNNQLTLFNYEINYHRHLMAHEIQLSKLEAVVGKRIF